MASPCPGGSSILVGERQAKKQTDNPERRPEASKSALDRKYAALDDFGRHMVDMVVDAETERVQAQEKEAEAVVVDLGTIRRYLYGAAAGPDGMSVNDYEDIPRTEDMPRCADYCISISGDSMEPYLYDGQTVYVCRDRKVDIGEVGVWTYHDGTYIKQYDRRKDGVYLLSANPDRESLNVRIANEALNELHYHGKVLGIKKLPLPVYR